MYSAAFRAFAAACATCSIALLAIGCSSDDGDKDRPDSGSGKTIVQVGSSTIPQGEFAQSYRKALRELDRVEPTVGVTRAHVRMRVRESILTDLIWKEWIEQEAKRRGLAGPQGPRRSPERAAALETKLFAQRNVDSIPSEREIRAYYKANRASYRAPLRDVRATIAGTLQDLRVGRERTLFQNRLRDTYLAKTRCSAGYDSPWCGGPAPGGSS